MRHSRILLIAPLLACAMTLSGCESFDPQDWFNPKKPLPGERRPVFPGGVPGVPQGVPPELVQGNQPQADAPPPQAAEAPAAEEPKPAPKPVAKPKPKPAPKPKQAAAPRPASAPESAPPPSAAPWPSPQQAGPSSSPFPDPPQR